LTSNSARAIKGCLTQALACFVALIVPVVVLKWGQANPRFHWQDLLAGKTSELTFESLQSVFAYGLEWQEKSALLGCLVVAAYIGLQLGFNVADLDDAKRNWRQLLKDPEWTFTCGSYIFLFLYIASTALCERIGMGTVAGNELMVDFYRDFGLALLAFCLLTLTRLVVNSVSFNGMVMRQDLGRAYLLILGACGALAMCFATWFPLLALPGAWIMTRWCLALLADIQTTYEEDAQQAPS
jgi:hypothetical protein